MVLRKYTPSVREEQSNTYLQIFYEMSKIIFVQYLVSIDKV